MNERGGEILEKSNKEEIVIEEHHELGPDASPVLHELATSVTPLGHLRCQS
jgi:hypothetical protein